MEDEMSATPVKGLEVEALCNRCDPDRFDFETTDELEELSDIIGQPRAAEAIDFGIGIQQNGYNIFAFGPPGRNKREFIETHFNQQAQKGEVPADWIYVHNFEESHKPNAIRMPSGVGAKFREDMNKLIEDLRTALSSAFESDEYRSRVEEVQREFRETQEKALEDLRKKAEEEGMTMVRTPVGFVFAPVREGEVVSPEEFQELPEDERERFEEKTNEFQEELQQILQELPRKQRDMRKRIEELNREMAALAVGGLIEELREKYEDIPEIEEFLNAVEEDIVNNVRMIVAEQEGGEQSPQRAAIMAALGQEDSSASPFLRRYRVNLLVDHSESTGAPVVFEDNPSYQNLVGRVEHTARMGALVTDFNLIKPGALHRANGGYLILEARKLLTQPYAWEGFKRALRSDKIRIESPGQMYSLISTISLEPEPIPLDVKVALVGEPLIYYLLSELEPEFPELFKVAADFAGQMDRNDDNQMLYAQMIAGLGRENELRSLDRGAVARVVEHSARQVGDGEKLSTSVRSISDLLREADYWAGESEKEIIRREDVQKAIDKQIFRLDRLRERIQESILRDIVLIDTDGESVGQVNGLSVLSLGDFAFGRPSRITGRVRLGKGEVIDIEREVELGGPIHSKGVFILSAFMGARFSEDRPLSLNASLVFEQSYGGVEGDSASSAELYALLSAVSEVPIRQSMAVTGSVNQHGRVQAIGGVNEKIEGFFDICKSRGLTGDQGVLIPASNVKHLMLRQDVIDAVADGKFAIYPVSHVDEGIELLTGMPAGEPDEAGRYPEDSINGLVQRRLEEMAEQRAEFRDGDSEEDGGE
jgi:lon-related putative ATP-dependent protease